jgi:hypothetical protein
MRSVGEERGRRVRGKTSKREEIKREDVLYFCTDGFGCPENEEVHGHAGRQVDQIPVSNPYTAGFGNTMVSSGLPGFVKRICENRGARDHTFSTAPAYEPSKK